ncbi:nucleotide-diphospho-sugar transferase [Hyaloraphidium curvatum]|nr:nucleotide-diphospho-sugar transferase [Hyaloraphidium curvatum]
MLRWRYALAVAAALLAGSSLAAPFVSSPPREAVATLVTSPGFVAGAAVLARTVRRHSPGRDLLALIPAGNTLGARHRTMLAQVGWRLADVADVPFPVPVHLRWKDMLVKLHLFKLIQYDAVAYLDADAYLVGEIDVPFRVLRESGAPLAAVVEPSRLPVSPYNETLTGAFNAGVFWIKPTGEDGFRNLVDRAGTYSAGKYGDQPFLVREFAWVGVWLPAAYNSIFKYRTLYPHPGYPGPQGPRVIHFAGNFKPWALCVGHPETKNVCDQQHPYMEGWNAEFAAAFREMGWTEADFAGENGTVIVDFERVFRRHPDAR